MGGEGFIPDELKTIGRVGSGREGLLAAYATADLAMADIRALWSAYFKAKVRIDALTSELVRTRNASREAMHDVVMAVAAAEKKYQQAFKETDQ